MIAELKANEIQLSEAEHAMAKEYGSIVDEQLDDFRKRSLELRDDLTSEDDTLEQIRLRQKVSGLESWIQALDSLWSEWRHGDRIRHAEEQNIKHLLDRIIYETGELNFQIGSGDLTSPSVHSSGKSAEALMSELELSHNESVARLFENKSLAQAFKVMVQHQRAHLHKQLALLKKHRIFGKVFPYVTAVITPILSALIPPLVAGGAIVTTLAQKLVTDLLLAAGNALVNLSRTIPEQNWIRGIKSATAKENEVERQINEYRARWKESQNQQQAAEQRQQGVKRKRLEAI